MGSKLELGLMVGLSEHVAEAFHEVTRVGLYTCQLGCWKPSILSDVLAQKVCEASASHGVRVSAYWAGYSGTATWNFLQGPTTIGLVPPATRAQRAAELKQGADFAHKIGAPAIATHVGFIPEDPSDPKYVELVPVIRDVAQYCRERGLKFLFETGQETPVVILRCIEDVGLDNVGVNLDPANLVLYGKANPVDALDIFGKYVWGMHGKDGLYPTNGRELGKEVPIGQGKVDFPRLIGRLKKEFGFPGPITIEREIRGPQQVEDIRRAIEILAPLL